MRRFLGHKKTIEVVELLTEITEIIGTTKEEILQALKNNFSDFEDSIQYSTPLKIKNLDAIITSKIKDYKHSSIPVMSPFHFLKIKNLSDE